MYNPSRDQARQFLFDAWRKYRQARPLTALETMAVDILVEHPEYHTLLDARDKYRERDYLPEQGETNPFLHLSMHLAIGEQVSVDRPSGIRDAVRKLAERFGSMHEAEHEVMDCLAETIWQSQRAGTAPDTAIYLECLQQKLQAKI
jgi:hypothetical protein